MKRFRKQCIACDAKGVEMNHEHFWPEWLIELTQTAGTGVRWSSSKKITPRSTKIPICKRCNAEFGNQLESPAANILRDVLAGRGLSGNEAELLIRWLWKFEGFGWRIAHPYDYYALGETIRTRVLNPIRHIRDDIVLAIALVETIEPEFGDEPMGLDSENQENAIFVSAVFSRIALMSMLRQLSYGLPKGFTIIPLPKAGAADADAKLHHPDIAFRNCVDAVAYMMLNAPELAAAHDTAARQLQARFAGQSSPGA